MVFRVGVCIDGSGREGRRRAIRYRRGPSVNSLEFRQVRCPRLAGEADARRGTARRRRRRHRPRRAARPASSSRPVAHRARRARRSIVPTSVRTWWRRKRVGGDLEPQLVADRVPARRGARVRTKSRCCVSAGVKARKSCVPDDGRGAARRARPGRARRGWCSARRASSGARVARDPHAVDVRARAGRVAGVEARRRLARRRAPRRPSAARRVSARAATAVGGPPSTVTLTTWPSACTPVSVRPATRSPSSPGTRASSAARSTPSHRPQARLRAPSRGSPCRRRRGRAAGCASRRRRGVGRRVEPSSSCQPPPPRATRTRQEQRQHRRHDQVRAAVDAAGRGQRDEHVESRTRAARRVARPSSSTSPQTTSSTAIDVDERRSASRQAPVAKSAAVSARVAQLARRRRR